MSFAIVFLPFCLSWPSSSSSSRGLRAQRVPVNPGPETVARGPVVLSSRGVMWLVCLRVLAKPGSEAVLRLPSWVRFRFFPLHIIEFLLLRVLSQRCIFWLGVKHLMKIIRNKMQLTTSTFLFHKYLSTFKLFLVHLQYPCGYSLVHCLV